LGAFDVVKAVEFGQAVDDFAHARAEELMHLFRSHFGIFDDVVEDGCHNGRGAQANLALADDSYFKGVGDVGLPALAPLVGMGVIGELVGSLDHLSILLIEFMIAYGTLETTPHRFDEAVILFRIHPCRCLHRQGHTSVNLSRWDTLQRFMMKITILYPFSQMTNVQKCFY